MIYCCGYPKSGNTWTNYICLTLLGVDFDNIHTQNEWPGVYRKTHAVREDEVFDKNNLLITPVRDYKECIISYRAGHSIDKLVKHIGSFKPGVMNYIRPLEIHDSWPEERRLMIYYEDLITEPYNSIYKLSDFIIREKVASNYAGTNFIYKIHDHKKRCLSHYNGDCQESKSDGNHVDFHKNILSEKEKMEWDEAIKRIHPILFEKYLTRYALKNT